jgi:hypothetical protein
MFLPTGQWIKWVKSPIEKIISCEMRWVAGALTYIGRRFTDPALNPDVVLAACGVPPRTLTRLFRQHLDCSVAGEMGSGIAGLDR